VKLTGAATPLTEGVMKRKLAGVPMVDALASARVGVALIVGIATVCAAATFYESRHGTAATQRNVYQTGWFTSLLVLLGINIAFAVIRRYPWTKHQAGFLMAHVGILILLCGSLVSLHLGLDGSLALYEGEEGDRVSLPAQSLHVGLPGHEAHGTFGIDLEGRPPGPGRELRFAVPGSAATLVVEDTLPNAEVKESIVEGEQGTPALHFSLQGFAGEGWLTAGDATRDHFDFGPVSFDLQVAQSDDELARLSSREEPVNRLTFLVDAKGGLQYVLTSRKAPAARGEVQTGRPIETPWMGMKVVVDRVLPKAVWARTVTGAPAPAGEQRRVPAVRVRLEDGSTRSQPEWLLWTEVRQIPFAGGLATLAFRAPEVGLPFRVQLVDFKSEKYPGSDRPASYESRVRVDDPERGISEHVISMNHPLHYRGYVFFQSSFVEGEPMASIFSVARAPGLPLVYLGTALICLGVGWMFYVKPWLARRQGARAVAIRASTSSSRPGPAVTAGPAPTRG
jgi:hypothetical protein